LHDEDIGCRCGRWCRLPPLKPRSRTTELWRKYYARTELAEDSLCNVYFVKFQFCAFRVMLRSLFYRPGLVRGFGLQHLPQGEVVLAAAYGHDDRKQTGGVGLLWAVPLPIVVAAGTRRRAIGKPCLRATTGRTA
jgi:hypothetical protein